MREIVQALAYSQYDLFLVIRKYVTSRAGGYVIHTVKFDLFFTPRTLEPCYTSSDG